MTQFGFIAPVYHNQERDDVAFCNFANEQFHAYKNESPYETPGYLDYDAEQFKKMYSR